MSADDFQGPWAKRQRLAYIEQCLTDPGRVIRGDIRVRFGVSEQTASADFSEFKRQRPNRMQYDATEKAYRPVGATS